MVTSLVILAGSNHGASALHLKCLIEHGGIDVQAVLLSKGKPLQKKKFFLKKVSKVIRIGILGALNGLRIRRWYKYDTPYSLESLCRQFNIPFYIVPGVNHGVTAEIIAKLNPDLGLSLGNGYISKRIFQTPKFGMINIHHEYLPDFQNAQSVIWQLYYGSPATGFSIHKISQKIDAGDILYREQVPIVFENSLKETVRCSIVDLYKKSSQKLPDVIANYKEYSDKATPQQAGKIHTTPKISEFMIMIRNYKKLRNQIF